ncbi:MAG TPA: ABC transporter permease [Dictyobacter sp.]|jgi:ABC-type dipeptide/oligopeptide/nickel transport system permease subunit|nr:ABC transporter permease [Dictyobacter sp.]
MDTTNRNQDLTTPGVMVPGNSTHPDPSQIGSTPPTPGSDNVSAGTTQKSLTPFQESMKRLRRDKRAMVSAFLLLFFVLIAIVGPPIYMHIGGTVTTPEGIKMSPAIYHSPFRNNLDYEDLAPNGMFWLGTDAVGHDLLARLMQSLLISLIAAVLVEIIDISFGITVGVLAGFYGGWIDQILARFTDIMFAFPSFLFLMLLAAIFGPWADTHLNNIPILGQNGNARLLLISLAVALTSWPAMARYVRGQTLQIKESQYIEAARTSGTNDFKILTRHIVPNLFSIVIVASTLNISNTIINEAGISMLGLGVKAPGSSLGLMISDSLGSIETPHSWEVLLPCIVLAIIVLAFSFLGDGLRDAFDPRSKD